MRVLGIDPGPTNLGIAVIEDGKPIFATTLNPSLCIQPVDVVEEIRSILRRHGCGLVAIERYVLYGGRGAQHSEVTQALVGASNYMASSIMGCDVRLFKAAEWQRDLWIHFHPYEKPPKAIGKPYSREVAAAHGLTVKVKDQHQADAFCIALRATLP